jgi:hypothetical protein
MIGISDSLLLNCDVRFHKAPVPETSQTRSRAQAQRLASELRSTRSLSPTPTTTESALASLRLRPRSSATVARAPAGKYAPLLRACRKGGSPWCHSERPARAAWRPAPGAGRLGRPRGGGSELRAPASSVSSAPRRRRAKVGIATPMMARGLGSWKRGPVAEAALSPDESANLNRRARRLGTSVPVNGTAQEPDGPVAQWPGDCQCGAAPLRVPSSAQGTAMARTRDSNCDLPRAPRPSNFEL